MAKLVGISIITTVLLLLIGVAVFFFLMLGMNGMQGHEATPVFVGYLMLLGLTLLGCGIGSGWAAGALERSRGWSMWAVAPLVIFVMTAAGGVTLFFGGIIIMVIGIETR